MDNRLGVTSHQTGLRGSRNSPEEQQVKCRAVSCWAQPGLLQTQLPEVDANAKDGMSAGDWDLAPCMP